MENIFFEGFFDPKADVVPLVLALLIVFINTFVVVLIFRKKYLRTNTNLLLWSLAMSDLLTGVVSVPLFITCNIIRQSAICIMEEQMSRFISASIVCHLMSVTIDRYNVKLTSLMKFKMPYVLVFLYCTGGQRITTRRHIPQLVLFTTNFSVSFQILGHYAPIALFLNSHEIKLHSGDPVNMVDITNHCPRSVIMAHSIPSTCRS